MKLKVGDKVRVLDREQTAKDIRENTYFPHLAGLEGTITKIYSPDEVCVAVERETLPEQNAVRHAEIEQHLHERWMDSISQEARSNLSDEEKQFRLNYTVLVPESDLELAKPGKRPAKRSVPATEQDERLHTQDLDRTEEEFLRNRAKS